MADIQDTDKFLVSRSGSSYSVDASELMAEIQDDDLMLVNRAGVSYKVTGLEVKDSLGPKDAPPSMTGATLVGTGASFSGQTYTTTLTDYDPGYPEADQTMLAKVTGALSVAGETSAITGVTTNSILWSAAPIIQGAFFDASSTLTSLFNGSLSNPGFAGASNTTQCTADFTSYNITGTIEIYVSAGGGYTNSWQYNGTYAPNGSGWVTLPDNYLHSLSCGPYAQLAGVRVDGVILLDTDPLEETVLTLTDSTDLDNGLFQPGDEVQGSSAAPAEEMLMGNHSPGSSISNQPTFSSYFDKGDTTTPWNTYNVTFKILPSLASFSSGIGLWYSSDGVTWTRDSSTNVDSPQTLPGGSTHTSDRYFAISTYSATNPPADSAPSCYMEVNSAPTTPVYSIVGTGYTGLPTVVSVDSSVPEMTVSGGTWIIGDTVQNTVARPPELTPITDEIVGYSEIAINAFRIGANSQSSWDTATEESVSAGVSYNMRDNLKIDTGSLGSSYELTLTHDGANSFYFYSTDDPAGTMTTTTPTGENPVILRSADKGGNSISGLGRYIDVYGGGSASGNFTLTGTVGSQNILTLATDKDLANFNAGDDVVQDSGYTPQTSAITQVDQVTIPISGGGIAWSSGIGTEATWADYPDLTTFDFGDNTSYTINSVSNVLNNPAMGIWESDSPNGPWTRLSSVGWNEFPYNQSINKRYVRFSLYGGSQTTNATVSLTNVDVTTTVLTLTDDTDLANFRVGDEVYQNPGDGTSPYALVSDVTGNYDESGIIPEDWSNRNKWLDNINEPGQPQQVGGTQFTVTWANLPNLNKIYFPTYTIGVSGWRSRITGVSGDISESVADLQSLTDEQGTNGLPTLKADYGVYGFTPTKTSGSVTFTGSGALYMYGLDYFDAPPRGTIGSISGNTITLSESSGPWDDSGTKYAIGPATTPATGTVASTDPAANTMTLSASDESGTKRWIVNAGKTVIGPKGPATRFDAYLTWSGNQVTGISITNPGYFQAPPDLELQFTDPAPTGNTWDVELPAGTTIATRVKATNDSGEADSGWTNVVTPRFLLPGDALSETFAETSLRMRTFDNRAEVNEGNVAMQQRSTLASQLVADGYDQADVDLMLPIT